MPRENEPPPAVITSIPFPTMLKLSENPADDWKKFKRRWTNYEVASRTDKQPPEVRVASFETCLGDDGQEILEGLKFDNAADRSDIQKIMEKLQEHFVGKTNESYLRYVFNTRNQQPGETFDKYVSQLRTMIKGCNYGQIEDDLLRDRIVAGIKDDNTRKRLLQTDKLTLNQCIQICKTFEITEKQLKDMSHAQADSVHKVTYSKSARSSREKTSSQEARKQPRRKCRFCAQEHVFKKTLCRNAKSVVA